MDLLDQIVEGASAVAARLAAQLPLIVLGLVVFLLFFFGSGLVRRTVKGASWIADDSLRSLGPGSRPARRSCSARHLR